LVRALGYAPALDACAQDGRPLPAAGPVRLSVLEGGALCDACARSGGGIELPSDSRRDLADLLSQERDLPLLDHKHAAAHRRLLARWIRTHAGDTTELPAVEFWQERPWERGTGNGMGVVR
jgi:recombinational DNA repair protein (RecF pathway)